MQINERVNHLRTGIDKGKSKNRLPRGGGGARGALDLNLTGEVPTKSLQLPPV